MSLRYKFKRRRRYFDNRKCQKCGKRWVKECFLPEPPRFFFRPRRHLEMDRPIYIEREPDELLCVECAIAAGYCGSCGEFWGGIDSFEFKHQGLCDHCYDEVREDCEDLEHEEGDFL